MKTPARNCVFSSPPPSGMSVYCSPGVKSPTTPRITPAPGIQRGSGTYSPNGIRRILSYCAATRPCSFTRTAAL
jgi:hypothetical protein